MSDGVSTYLADKWLAWLAGNAETAPTGLYVQLHTADPGTAGTTAVSSVTTREALTFGTASAGAMASSNTPTWATWAGTNAEVDTDMSVWDASSSGDFLDSITFTSSVTMYTGDTLEITSVNISFTTAS